MYCCSVIYVMSLVIGHLRSIHSMIGPAVLSWKLSFLLWKQTTPYLIKGGGTD